MELTVWLQFATVCAIGAMSPGPSLAIVMKHTLGGGAKNGVISALSHGLGVGVYAVAAVLGLSSLMKSFPIVYNFLVYSGAAYLLFLGYKALTSKGASLTANTSEKPLSAFDAAKDGFAIAFLNPKLAIFFTALFSQFISPDNMSLQTSALMVTTVLTIDSIWYFVVAILIDQSKERLSLLEKGPVIDKVIGVIFVALAIRVVTI